MKGNAFDEIIFVGAVIEAEKDPPVENPSIGQTWTDPETGIRYRCKSIHPLVWLGIIPESCHKIKGKEY